VFLPEDPRQGRYGMCPLSTMADLHQIIRESDKVVTF